MITLVPLDSIDPARIETLLDRAFGPDRIQRTAYAIRGSGPAIAVLSFAAIEDGGLLGSIQCWPVALANAAGAGNGAGEIPMIMVGPVAVEPTHQGDGIGRRLMHCALDAAADEGLDGALMLIGDPDYYGRFFNFTADRTTHWAAPGPVERHRLLARGNAIPDAAGMLGPRSPVVASV